MAAVLTCEEVAQRLRVSKRLVYAMIRRGELRAVRAGRLVRIPEAALEDFLRTEALLPSRVLGRLPWTP